jgi:putative intracellular protease/amidase
VGDRKDPGIHVLVFDGLADWEPGHALAELRRSGGLDVVAVGFTANAVTTMGGLRILPELLLSAVVPGDVRLLLLPGGEMWEGEYPRAALDALLRALTEKRIPVAAICGATLALARVGLLDDRRHTSNAPEYLAQYAASYKGSRYYVPELAIRDRGVITASGLGCVEFAREIFEELGVFSPDERSQWFEMFKYGKMPPAA